MKLNFKQRDQTRYIYIHQFDTRHKTLAAYNLRMIRAGEYDCGFHYFIQEKGTVECNRPLEVVPGWSFENTSCSIYIAVQTKDGNLSDSQHTSLDILLEEIKSKYGELKLVIKTGEDAHK